VKLKSKVTLKLSKREFWLFIIVTVGALLRALKWLLVK
jgi:hypothetical protein